MSNNPFATDIINHIEQTGDKDKLRLMCTEFIPSSCPCVGRTSLPGQNVRLVSTHPGYPDYKGNPCIETISGEQLATTPEYKECLLAATCKHFFPEMTDKFDVACKNPRECNVPEYIGLGTDARPSATSAHW